jgi:hypothetical protein
MAIGITIVIDQNSQSVSNNTSNVTVKVNASWTGGSYNTLQKPGWLKIDGTTYEFTSSFNTGRTNSGTQTLFSKTVNVSHASDGKKTLQCSASYTSGVSSGTVGASASKVLTTIPRKSSMTVSNGTLGTDQTLTVTRQSTSFTHTITYKCGTATGTVCTKSSNTSISWTPPLSLASQNTTGTSVSVTFTITTYSGNTNIGTNTKTISCSIPSSVKPSCTLSITDTTNTSEKYGGFAKGLSKLKIVVTPTTAYGSDISTYKTKVDGLTYSKASFTTNVLSTSGTITVTTTITDKRGRSYTKTENLTVLNYNPPSISKLSVRRCNEDGSEASDQGEYIQVSFNSTVTSMNSLNTASHVLRYKRSSDANYTEIELNDYDNMYSVTNGAYMFQADTSSSYNIDLLVSDNHVTVHKITSASTGFTLMHWNKTGDGMAVGKLSELPDVFDIGFMARFYGGIMHMTLEPETDLNDVRTPNTYIGANVTTYKYANCPLISGTFTLEVVGMGDAGQVKQKLTYCHKTAAKTWERIYYGSSWGEWICTSDFDGELLWDGVYYMSASQTVNLSESIGKQRSGIVLVFSLYQEGAAKNAEWVTHYVPKYMITHHPSGGGYSFLCNTPFRHAIKYLYITDTQITGHDDNDGAKTVDGINYTNNEMVLRYVIGV